MLDKTTYLNLMKDFSNVASWAIWERPLAKNDTQSFFIVLPSKVA
jgi:hypothetical protein